MKYCLLKCGRGQARFRCFWWLLWNKCVCTINKSIIQIQRSFNLQLFDILYILVSCRFPRFTFATWQCRIYCVPSPCLPHVPRIPFVKNIRRYETVELIFFTSYNEFCSRQHFQGMLLWKRTWWGSYCGQPNGLALSKHHGSVLYLTASSSMFLLFFTFYDIFCVLVV